MNEETKPVLRMRDGVQISVDDLPEEARGTFGRLQRLTQKKAHLALDLEELQAGINFFNNQIIAIINKVEPQASEDDVEVVDEELSESNDSD